jgi:hypothetical protein
VTEKAHIPAKFSSDTDLRKILSKPRSIHRPLIDPLVSKLSLTSTKLQHLTMRLNVLSDIPLLERELELYGVDIGS